MGQLLSSPYSYFSDANGLPLAGGLVYTYAAGTTTPQAAYTDSTFGTPLANPVPLDSAGRAEIWLNGSYKIVVKDSLFNTIHTTDNISALTTSNPFSDATAIISNAADSTKKILISAASISSGVTRTYTGPDKNGILALTSDIPSAVTVLLYGAITGCLLSSIAGANTTATITVGTGQAADSGNTVNLTSAGYSWAVSNGNAINGYSGGTTLPNSSTIHMYLCTGGTGTGVYAVPNSSFPLSAGSAPAGYNTSIRRIGSFNTTSAGAPIPYTATEIAGGGARCMLSGNSILDVNNAATTTANRTLTTVTVPLGIKVTHIGRFQTGSTGLALVTSPDEADQAPATGATPLYDMDSGTGATQNMAFETLTNTSAQIGIRASATTTNIYVATRGFVDFRRG